MTLEICNKKTRSNASLFILLTSAVSVTVSTLQVSQPRWIWVERKLSNFTATSCTGPVTLNHCRSITSKTTTIRSTSIWHGFFVTVSALQISQSVLSRLKWKLCYCAVTFGAGPVSVEHLPVVVVVRHFIYNIFFN